MNISFRLLFLTIPLSFCSPSSSMGMACELGSAEWITPDKKQTEEPSHQLKLIMQEANELDTVLTLDERYYENHIYQRVGSEKLQRQLMAESVAHIYLIPSVRTSLALIKQLAKQEKTDPEMDNLKLAVAALLPLELKYLKTTYEWEKNQASTDSTPVHRNARSTPLGRQHCLIQCTTTDYQASMSALIATYKEHRKAAREQDQKEVDKLKEKLAEVQSGSASCIPETAPSYPYALSKDH